MADDEERSEGEQEEEVQDKDPRIYGADAPLDWGKHLRACMRPGCGLLKTFEQFYDKGCENCTANGFTDEETEIRGNKENVQDATTQNFNGMITLVNPQKSWSARWLGLTRVVPGVYALSVNEELPDHMRGDAVE